MKKIFFSALCALALGMTFTSCNDDDNDITPDQQQSNKFCGALLINEGSMGMNNAAVTYYDYNSGEVKSYEKLTSLGDVANDAVKANGKLYVALSSSKSLAVISQLEETDMTVEQISLDYQPRYMAEKDGYLYISCYGGNVLKFNLNTNKVEATLNLTDGKNLEGVAILGDTLYVCNSYYQDEYGSYNYLDQLMTVSLSNFKQGNTHKTVLNPNYLTVVNNRLFVLGFGDYYMNPYQLAEQLIKTDNVKPIAEATKMCAWGDKVLYADSQTDWSQWPNISTNTTFGAYDTKADSIVNPFSTMPQSVSKESIYFLSADPNNNSILMGVTDYVSTSTVHQFDAQGRHQNSFDSKGVNTNKAVFVNM